MLKTYTPPVSQLLSYGECQAFKVHEWPNYVEALGLTAAHIPELIAMMQDTVLYNLDPEGELSDLPDDLDPDFLWYAPIHAWRALGQLQAEEFLAAAIANFHTHDDFDWMWQEFPDVIQLIGPKILDSLGTALQTESALGEGATTFSEGLRKLGITYPETRDRCVTYLTQALENHTANSPSFNGSLVVSLLELNATEAIEVMEAAYQAESVDEMFAGSWPRIQVDLGLKQREDFTAEELKPKLPPNFEQMQAILESWQRRNKPSAYELGLPLDRSQFTIDDPGEFKNMLPATAKPNAAEKKGFGGSSPAKKKGKKKKR